MRRIGVVTTSRADYGVYLPLLRALQADPEVDLGLYVSGTHLSPEFGLTVRAIEADGFKILERIEVVLSADTPQSIATSMGLGLMGFARAFNAAKPDILVVLGDRYEMLAAALAALPFKIPVAHIGGGESTEGAIDEALRHSMTKLSHLHFTSTREYAERVMQLGESPEQVTVSGEPHLDNMPERSRVTAHDLREKFGVDVTRPFLLVTFHPVTLEYEDAERQIDELLAALEMSGLHVVFTMPNADTAGRVIGEKIRAWTKSHDAVAVENFGAEAYQFAMARAAAMVGNSSSGIIEAPSFKTPVVNLGNRQKGRVRARNVIDVGDERGEILAGIRKAVAPEFRGSLNELTNPYASPDGSAATTIVNKLKSVKLDGDLVRKTFHDL